MNCQQATRFISDARDRPLRLADRAGLQVHLMACTGCRRFEQQVQALGEFGRAWVDRWGEAGEEDTPPER